MKIIDSKATINNNVKFLTIKNDKTKNAKISSKVVQYQVTTKVAKYLSLFK